MSPGSNSLTPSSIITPPALSDPKALSMGNRSCNLSKRSFHSCRCISCKDGNNKQLSIFGIWNRSSQLVMIMTVVVCFCFLWPCVVCGHHTPVVQKSISHSFSPRQIDSHPSASSSDRSWAPQMMPRALRFINHPVWFSDWRLPFPKRNKPSWKIVKIGIYMPTKLL